MKTPALIQIVGCVGPRAEYFIGLPGGGKEPWDIGGIAVYAIAKPGAPDRVWMMRVFAFNHQRFELLNLATFWMN